MCFESHIVDEEDMHRVAKKGTCIYIEECATHLQMCFESRIIEDEDMHRVAKKGIPECVPQNSGNKLHLSCTTKIMVDTYTIMYMHCQTLITQIARVKKLL